MLKSGYEGHHMKQGMIDLRVLNTKETKIDPYHFQATTPVRANNLLATILPRNSGKPSSYNLLHFWIAEFPWNDS